MRGLFSHMNLHRIRWRRKLTCTTRSRITIAVSVDSFRTSWMQQHVTQISKKRLMTDRYKLTWSNIQSSSAIQRKRIGSTTRTGEIRLHKASFFGTDRLCQRWYCNDLMHVFGNGAAALLIMASVIFVYLCRTMHNYQTRLYITRRSHGKVQT